MRMWLTPGRVALRHDRRPDGLAERRAHRRLGLALYRRRVRSSDVLDALHRCSLERTSRASPGKRKPMSLSMTYALGSTQTMTTHNANQPSASAHVQG